MTDSLRPQRRGRAIAMTDAEIDAFLGSERVCRVATTAADGPHVAPLWFVWHDGRLWLHSIVRSQRWTDLQRNPRVAVVVDAGVDYGELHGVEILGRATVVGEVPRTGEACPELVVPEQLFARKYAGSEQMGYDGRHAWVRIDHDKLTSWDFRKLAGS